MKRNDRTLAEWYTGFDGLSKCAEEVHGNAYRRSLKYRIYEQGDFKMNYYDTELQRLQSELMEKKRTEAKLSDLLIQQAELKKRVSELQKIMRDEQEDVDRLNSRSLTALFYRMTGKIGEKMSKEEQEAYAAAVKYDAAESELLAVEEDIAVCRKRLSELQWCEQEYQDMLADKREQIKALGTPEADRIMELEEQLIFLKNHQKETEEAVCAGRTAFSISCEVLEDLGNAKNWGVIDMLGGGLIADIVKYDNLNKAQDKIKTLQNSLRNFRTELADVTERISGDIHTEIGDFLCFADYFFDGLITDWMVYDKITESKDRAEVTSSQIQNVLKQLEQIQDSNISEQEQTEKQLEKMITAAKL